MAFFPDVSDINVNESRGIGIDFVFKDGSHVLNADGTLKVCSKRENIENWIRKVISTAVDAYEVYVKDESKSFGVNIYEKLGTKDRGYWLSELKREITEQLLNSNNIKSVTDFNIICEKRTAVVSFTVVTNDDINISNEFVYNV